MRIYNTKQSRQEYIQTQIQRSEKKFRFCKVSIQDTIKYVSLMRRYSVLNNINRNSFRIICTGTRNGREIDLFRLALNNPFRAKILRSTEWHTAGFHSIFDRLLLSADRSDLTKLGQGGVFGVEINPMAKRKDVHIGSFDELPQEWEGRFDVLYSNSFDHSQDPYKTAQQWQKIVKKGGLFIIALSNEEGVSITDPVGMIRLEDIRKLFPGILLYYQRNGSRNGYNEVILKKE
ncbi:MAG: hypothetical protein A2173_01370 [Planctomycetes bacterium RBG_13_44_8b]|nr:MAG: hypothetical protein A2173_01370 [Planctomycetes bacterium RBG_13_44_8b]